jgi:hypothetical protein
MKPLRFVFAVLLVGLSAQGAFGQDTTRVARDSATADSTRRAVLSDSVRPIPQLTRHYAGPAASYGSDVWVWDRASLNLEAPVTLGDLLERIPGVLTVRSGYYVQPEAATSMGGTGNRLEVWLDGYILDPLLESSVDLAKLELVNVESVRIEKRLATIRVFIETMMPADSRAYSMIEAAVGEPNASLLRGVFLAPKVLLGPLALGIDRIDTDGLRREEPADQFGGWAKWSFIRNGSGVQVEYRRMRTDREEKVAWPARHVRADLIVRARYKIMDGLLAEVFGGRSTLEIDTATANSNDSLPKFSEENMQYGVRASYVSPLFWARGSFRMRDAEQLASSQIDGAAGITYNILSAAAEFTQSSWRDAGGATELTLRAEAGPLAGFRVFGEHTTSDRGVPYLSGFLSPDSVPPVITAFKGYRAGGQFEWRGAVVGGALLKATTDSTTTFGLPFDRMTELQGGSDASGWELSGRVPIPFVKGLAAQGNVTNWYKGTLGLYMPSRIYRAGLEWHALPLKSGNLEILARIETVHRGVMLAPNFAAPAGTEPIVAMPATDVFDAYLQIRIMDVRAFLRWEDLAATSADPVAEIPERALLGPRIFYGVKWQFFN